MVTVLNQHIDTLKHHYYITPDIGENCIKKYNSLLEKMIVLKKESQTKAIDMDSGKDINIEIGVNKFNIMPKSVKGFSVIINNSDISIAFRKITTLNSGLPLLKVEFRAEFLARYGYMKCIKIVNTFITNNLLDSYKIKISEIHFATDIQGYEFNHLDYFRLKTRSRNSQLFEDNEVYSTSFGSLNNFTGFVYGSGDYMLRVYNKSKEINKFKNKGFVKDLFWSKNPDYDENQAVWRIEIQIRRAKLKKLTDENYDTLDDYETILNNIPSIWGKAVSDFRLMDISDIEVFNMLRGKRTLKTGEEKLITKHYRYNTFKKADIHLAWDSIQKFNNYIPNPINNAFKLPNKGSLYYVQNSIKALYSTMGKYYGAINKDTLVRAFKESNEQNKKTKEISLIDDAINKQLDYFERINQTRLCGVFDVPDYRDLQQDILEIISNQEYLYHETIEQSTKDRFIDIVNQNLNEELNIWG